MSDALHDWERAVEEQRRQAERLVNIAHDERCERLGAEARVEWLVDVLAEVSVRGGDRAAALIEPEIAQMTDKVRARYHKARASFAEVK